MKVNKFSIKSILKSINKNKKRKRYIYLTLSLVIVLVLLFIFRGLFLVAIVNNRPITRLSFIKQLEKDAGKVTLENIIVRELIEQEANRRSVTISQQDIQDEVDKLTEIFTAQGTTLDVALDMQGQTIENLKDNIKIQKTAEEILKDKISVSDDEVLQYFETNKEYYEDKEYLDLKEELKEQLKQQKLQEEFSKLLENLKDESDIRYLVNF